MAIGLDTDRNILQYVDTEEYKNAEFIARYLTGSGEKMLTLTEVDHIHNDHKYIVSIYETNPVSIEYFIPSAGERDGLIATVRMDVLTREKLVNAPIYFTIDFDVQPNELSLILQYFRNVYLKVPRRYGIGVYGSGLVCWAVSSMLQKEYRYTPYTWKSMSTGWTEPVNVEPVKYDLIQSVGGEWYDKDVSDGSAGGW